ncbi:hypothetical protein MRX96_016350 [Rhipicephalus microplus]
MRQFLCIAALYALLVPWMIYLTSRLELATLKRVSLSIKSDGPHYVINTSECLFPLYEPFHWSVAYLYRRRLSIENKCRGIEQFVFFVNVSVPLLNAKRLEDTYGLTPSSLQCHYHAVVGVSSGIGVARGGRDRAASTARLRRTSARRARTNNLCSRRDAPFHGVSPAASSEEATQYGVTTRSRRVVQPLGGFSATNFRCS